jgi:hypothetical protein
MGKMRCAHCKRIIPANPHITNQTHCSREACRKDKKRLWQRQKLATDSDYKENQRDCWKAWIERNPGYWKEYRKSHPQSADRNRLRQRERNRERRRIAKMDTFEPISQVTPGTYYLVPEKTGEEVIAKMDTLACRITVILIPCQDSPRGIAK